MTHSIISLGKAFPLDSLQRAILARWFWQAAGKDLRIPARSSSGFFSGPFWPTDFVTGKIKCRVAAPDFQPTLKCYRWNQVVILATWFSTGLEALQVESSAHFDHLIFTEWGWRVTDKTEVLKMITPVASLQMKSSYHFDNLILIRLQSSSRSGNLIRQELQIKLRKA